MATILKRCDCPEDRQRQCPHPWVVRYRTAGGRAGRQREASFGTDRREAEDFAVKVEYDKRARTFVDPRAGQALFRTEAGKWLDQHLGADSSIATYKSVLRAHVDPAIGATPIAAIRREDIKALIAGMHRKGLSPSRIGVAHLVISAVLAEAVRDRKLTESPCTGIQVPGAASAADFIIPAHDQVEALAAALPPDWAATVWLMHGCGLRIAARLAATDDDAFVAAFLSAQQALAGDLDTAVNLAEEALALEPDGWQHLSSLAHLLTRRSRSAQRRPDDQGRAIAFAERAVDQLHQWNGPSQEALRVLLRALTLTGAFSRVLDRALPPPGGRANEREATTAEVIAAAAAAARALGRSELADSLVGSLPDGIDNQFALLRHHSPGHDPDAARDEWVALLDQLDETRPEQLAQAVMRLADLGVDSSSRLDTLVQAGTITPQVKELARATAAAARDLSSALPALRTLADADDMAATKMIDLLMAADRLDDAQAAALSAYSRFGEPAFLVQAAELQHRLGLDREAQEAASFARMLDLADRFDDDPQFSGMLLSAVVARTRDEGQDPATPADTRMELAQDLRAQAFAAFTRHAERHGDASPIRMIRGDTTEDLLARMTEFMRQDHGPLLDVVEMIRQVRIPFGVLATMIRRPYSSTLAQRVLGYFIAGTSNDADDQADESTAAAARNRDIVVDVSALLVSSVLGEFEYARGQFRTLITPTASRQDVTAGRRDLDGRSAGSGSVFYDGTTDSLVASEPDISGHLAALERFTKLEQALARAQLTPAPPLTLLGEVAIPDAEAWLAPIALAKERGLALWSDDVAQRSLARGCGVSAFGTIMLQQLRAAERLSAEDADEARTAAVLAARRTETLQALGERVVDVITDAETITEQARSEDWGDPGLAAATVGRPTWWLLSPAPWNDLQAILAAARQDSRPVETWQATAMWGASALAPEDPSRMAALIAGVCLADSSSPDPVSHAAAMLRISSAVAAHRKARPPADYLAQAAAELAAAGVLAHPLSFIAEVRAYLNEEDDGEASADV